MKLFIFLLLFLVEAKATNQFESAFERVWDSGQAELYPETLIKKHFTQDQKLKLSAKLKTIQNWDGFENLINPFLLDIGVSHTQFYSIANIDYYFLKSLFHTKDITQPSIFHIGVQVAEVDGLPAVRSVLEGYPAHAAGIRRGDRMISVDGRPFHAFNSFNPGDSSQKEILFSRNGELLKRTVKPVFECPHYSFVTASKNSTRIIQDKGSKIGYFHLWAGTDDAFLKALEAAVDQFNDADGMILDLRDGFGGAWWDYLDLFFLDRENYFVAKMKGRSGETLMEPPQKENPTAFSKPLVIIANEGVRSGKESLVYQFKKTKRGVIVGTSTGGMFSMGKGLFSDENSGYIFYLSVGEVFLDGKKVEGVGIEPDYQVNYPLSEYSNTDPQLELAKQKMQGLLEQKIKR